MPLPVQYPAGHVKEKCSGKGGGAFLGFVLFVHTDPQSVSPDGVLEGLSVFILLTHTHSSSLRVEWA